MFERYTESARRALFFARYEASRLGSVVIDTEHLLLGIIRDGKGLAVSILARADGSLESLRMDVEERTVFRERVDTSVEIPFSEPMKHVLEWSAQEADSLGHNYIGPEHLLLGLLQDQEAIAGAALADYSFDLDDVREIVKQSAVPSVNGSVEQIERIKDLVRQLGRLPSGGNDARALIDRIVSALDQLKPPAE